VARVVVIDPSANVRETLAIILEHEHQVQTAPVLDDAGAGDTALVIAGFAAPPADAMTAATAPACHRPRRCCSSVIPPW
jgi:hypothetical protein